MDWIKKNILQLLLIGAVALLFLQRNPFGKADSYESKRDTVHSIQYVQQPPVIIPQYIPIKDGVQAPTVIPQDYIASSDYKELLKQYQDVVNKYLSTTTYKDSIELKDSTGKKVGIVNLEDKISKNEITSRKPNYQLTFPHTTTTITVTEPYKPKNQLYVGGGITGNQQSPVNGAYVGLLWKNKKDQIYSINTGILTMRGIVKPQFGVSAYWKLKFKK